jgi:hypothetical protein
MKHAILRNEPILFSRIFYPITFIYKNLCRLQRRLQMGSFWRNEPIFGVRGTPIGTLSFCWVSV